MNTKRKEKKKKERERAKTFQKHQQSVSRLYPKFAYDTKDADPRFVSIVKKALSQIDLTNQTLFTDWERELYKKGKRYGQEYIKETINKQDKYHQMIFLCKIGEIVYGMIGKDMLNWIPFHDFRILPAGEKIIVKFISLKSKKGRDGTVYYSKFEPKVTINGERKIIAFSRHAIEQTCNRIVPRWRYYSGSGDAFGFLSSCIYFEPYKEGFTFYDRCTPEFWNYQYVVNLLESYDEKKRYYYRVGYCPATVEGEFLKAKTLLVPGYRGTPEYELLHKVRIPYTVRKRMLDDTRDLNTLKLLQTQDFSTIKWFHDNGIPQVIQSNKEFYCYF